MNIISSALVLFLIGTPFITAPQTGGGEKFSDAVRRSQQSAKIINQISELTSGGIPKEVIKSAQAVLVFPNVSTKKVLFEKTTNGRGVACARQGETWTLPAYYNFGGLADFELGLGQESADIIILFMDKDAVSWFQKDVIWLTGEKTPLAGPLEPATEEQKTRARYTHIIAYSLSNGKLIGKTIETTMNKGFALGPDNHINQPLYQLKGPELLAGKQPGAATRQPQGVSAFQEALQKHWAGQ